MFDKIPHLIKVLALEAVEAEKISPVMFGVAESPDVVVVDGRMRLTGKMLSFLKGAEMQANDKVVLLREQGGQGFVVLGIIS